MKIKELIEILQLAEEAFPGTNGNPEMEVLFIGEGGKWKYPIIAMQNDGLKMVVSISGDHAINPNGSLLVGLYGVDEDERYGRCWREGDGAMCMTFPGFDENEGEEEVR